MYYICTKRNGNFGISYGIMDTDDGVIEFYSPQDVIKFVKTLGVSIEGVKLNKDTGKWHIQVVQPTSFINKGTDSDYVDNTEEVVVSTVDSDIKFRYLGNTLQVKYPESWGSLADITDSRLEKIFKPYETYLKNIISGLGVDLSKVSLEFADGCDCVGFFDIKLPNTIYTFDVYTNPSYYLKGFYESVPNGLVSIAGLGVDVHGIQGRVFDECHFDCELKSSFCSDFIEWLDKLVNKSSKNVITYNDSRILNLARLATKIVEMLSYDDIASRTPSEYKYWGRHNVIGAFKYNFKGDYIEASADKWDIDSISLYTCIFDIDSDIYWTLLKYDTETGDYVLYNSASCDSDCMKALSIMTPFADYIGKFEDEIFRGSINDFDAWLNNLVINYNKVLLTDNSDVLNKMREIARLYRTIAKLNPDTGIELCQFVYGNIDEPEQEILVDKKHLVKQASILVDSKTFLMMNVLSIKDKESPVKTLIDVWLDYYIESGLFRFRFVGYFDDVDTSVFINELDNKKLSYNDIKKFLLSYNFNKGNNVTSAEVDIISSDLLGINSIKVFNYSKDEVSAGVIGGSLRIYYPDTWGNFDYLSDEQLDCVTKPLGEFLCKFLSVVGLKPVKDFEYIDGTDCMGYTEIGIPRTNYLLEIFTSPDKLNNVRASKGYVDFTKFGALISDKSNKYEILFEFEYGWDFSKSTLSKFRDWLNSVVSNLSSLNSSDFISVLNEVRDAFKCYLAKFTSSKTSVVDTTEMYTIKNVKSGNYERHDFNDNISVDSNFELGSSIATGSNDNFLFLTASIEGNSIVYRIFAEGDEAKDYLDFHFMTDKLFVGDYSQLISWLDKIKQRTIS